MKVQTFDNKDLWEVARRGRITGTKADDIIPKRNGEYKIGFYEIIAERVAIPRSDENRMDRGIRLEDEAVARFAEETGKKVSNDLVIWSREDDDNIAISPDASVGKTEAVEVKCLSSAKHIEAYLTQKIPSDYEGQIIQYFIVNEKLKTLHFVFYDPSMPKDFFFIDVNRKDIQEKVDEYLKFEKEALAKIAEAEKQLTF